MRSSYKSLSQLVIIAGGPIPSWVLWESRLSKPGDRASKQHPSMASVLAPAFRFLPRLSSCLDFLQWWSTLWKCEPNKPFHPQAALGMVCHRSKEAPTKRNMILPGWPPHFSVLLLLLSLNEWKADSFPFYSQEFFLPRASFHLWDQVMP